MLHNCLRIIFPHASLSFCSYSFWCAFLFATILFVFWALWKKIWIAFPWVLYLLHPTKPVFPLVSRFVLDGLCHLVTLVLLNTCVKKNPSFKFWGFYNVLRIFLHTIHYSNEAPMFYFVRFVMHLDSASQLYKCHFVIIVLVIERCVGQDPWYCICFSEKIWHCLWLLCMPIRLVK